MASEAKTVVARPPGTVPCSAQLGRSGVIWDLNSRPWDLQCCALGSSADASSFSRRSFSVTWLAPLAR